MWDSAVASSTLTDAGPICMECADLDHLWFLPRGDAALTRRARVASTLAPVVLKWSGSRRRYERQGLLVEEAALAHAEESCLADVEARQRRRLRSAERRERQDVELAGRLTEAIRAQFPGCHADRAERIADRASQRGSGRIGRSRAGGELDPHAVRLAVVASVRHEDTDYDAMLMAGVPRSARPRPGPRGRGRGPGPLVGQRLSAVGRAAGGKVSSPAPRRRRWRRRARARRRSRGAGSGSSLGHLVASLARRAGAAAAAGAGSGRSPPHSAYARTRRPPRRR